MEVITFDIDINSLAYCMKFGFVYIQAFIIPTIFYYNIGELIHKLFILLLSKIF